MRPRFHRWTRNPTRKHQPPRLRSSSERRVPATPLFGRMPTWRLLNSHSSDSSIDRTARPLERAAISGGAHLDSRTTPTNIAERNTTSRAIATRRGVEPLSEQRDPDRDTGQRVHDEKGGLGGGQGTGGERRLEQHRSEHPAEDRRIPRPMDEQPVPAVMGEDLGGSLYERGVDRPHQGCGGSEQCSPAGGRSPTAEDKEHHDDHAGASERRNPSDRRRMTEPFLGMGRHQKPDQARAQEGGGAPGRGRRCGRGARAPGGRA